jgi:hypothetical protein
MTGEHFSFVMAEESMGAAAEAWADLHDPDSSSLRLRFVVRRKDGTAFPTEVSAVGIFEDGDVTENAAAARLANAVAGENLVQSAVSGGRINLLASTRGIFWAAVFKEAMISRK